MLKNLKINTAALIAAGAGLVGLGALALLYETCVDEKGLLVSGHPMIWVLGLLTAAATVLIFLYCRASSGSDRFADHFPASYPGAVGSFAAGFGVLVTVLAELGSDTTLPGILCTVLGFLAVVSFCVTGVCRFKGQRPLSLYHACVCLYFALTLVCRYRAWSADPQLPNYIFQLLSTLGLMLTAYHRAAFDAGVGKRRSLLFFSLMTVVFSIMALWRGEPTVLYVSCGAWVFTNILQLPAKEE